MKPSQTEPEPKLSGLKYFSWILPVFRRLRNASTERDTANNRTFFYDHFANLLLLFYFCPALDSLRAIQRASKLKRIQYLLGVPYVSTGSFSEAHQVFDPKALEEIFKDLARRVEPRQLPGEHYVLRNLIAGDGSLLPAVPRMAWALWQSENNRAAKLHLQLEVARGIPVAASITAGNDSEVEQLTKQIQSDRVYVLDRGYATYKLIGDILAAGSSIILRIRNDAVYNVIERHPLSKEAIKAGVISDEIIDELGCNPPENLIGRKLRIVQVATGKKSKDGSEQILVLVTDLLDVPAELIALGYKKRWSVEIFFVDSKVF